MSFISNHKKQDVTSKNEEKFQKPNTHTHIQKNLNGIIIDRITFYFFSFNPPQIDKK